MPFRIQHSIRNNLTFNSYQWLQHSGHLRSSLFITGKSNLRIFNNGCFNGMMNFAMISKCNRVIKHTTKKHHLLLYLIQKSSLLSINGSKRNDK
jgi:hypothetical protein